jgi:organic radical activating enzyme
VSKTTGQRPEFNEIEIMQWMEIIEREKPSVIVFSGGEPFTYPLFHLLVNSLVAQKYLIRITTNLMSKNGLRIFDSWRVLIYATYHKGASKKLFIENLKQYRKKFFVNVWEFGKQVIPGSKLKQLKNKQSDKELTIYAPDGRRFNSHIELEKAGLNN